MSNPQFAMRNSQFAGFGRRTGQAMVELLIFGSFLLFGFVLLVRFALGANYQQTIIQQAFRKTLFQANKTWCYDRIRERPDPNNKCDGFFQSPLNQASVLFLKDQPLVNPANPLAPRQRQPTVGAAGVYWGNDLGEFVPAQLSQMGVLAMRFNDGNPRAAGAGFGWYAFWMNRGRIDKLDFKTQDVESLLCRYSNTYDMFFVEFCNARLRPDGQCNDLDTNKGVIVDYQACEKDGRAKLKNKKGKSLSSEVRSKIVEVAILIVDPCLGDIVDPESCHTQCNRIVKNCVPRPKPDYCPTSKFCATYPPNCVAAGSCATLPGENELQGVDLGNFTRDTTFRGNLTRLENPIQLITTTNALERHTVKRAIKTTYTVNTPQRPYDPDKDNRIELESTFSRQRREQWTTPW